MKQQIILIHGGDSYPNREAFLKALKNFEVTIDDFRPRNDWKTHLPKTLGSNYEILAPKMPNKYNARYEEWKIWFEKMLPFIQDNAILVGHSMGAIFLVKYLSENTFPNKLKKLILVAAPHNNTADIGDFRITQPLDRINKTCEEVHFFHSSDDHVVPISELDEFKKELPNATYHTFSDRAHFNQEQFPEIVSLIKE